MDTEITYHQLKQIALEEFADIVVSATIIRGALHVVKSLRIFLKEDSFLELWLSDEKYSYHWQRVDGTIFRHDNAPHKKHRSIKTFPKHFHVTTEENTKESYISENPEEAIREILSFIRLKMN